MIEIGRSNAIIYECKNIKDNKTYAIKFYKTEFKEDV